MLKKVTAVVLTLCMLSALLITVSPANDEELPFTDVPKGKWFYSAVKYAYDIGIMNGTNTAGTIFEPNTTVTRAMFVAMLGRLHGAEQTLVSQFPDVKSDKLNWYNGYVGWASENGIITGYDNGKFGPNDPVTREQMAVIISRYITYTGILAKLNIDAPAYFPDIDSVANYAKKSVESMRMMGIIQGNSAGEFDPKSGLNRASAATIIMRLDMMIKELALEEPIRPDYTVEGENFALMGAYDLYYGGTALDTGYDGLGVKTEGGYPFITYDENGHQFISSNSSRKGDDNHTFNVSPETNTLVKDKDHFFEVDLRVACIDPAKLPVIRIAYRTDGNAELGIWSNNVGGKTLSASGNADKVTGFRYSVIDLSKIDSWNETSEQVIITLTSSASVDLLYLAAFPDVSSAESFDVTKFKSNIEKYDGNIVEVKSASNADVDAALAEADAKAQAIINNSDNIDPTTVTGTCYYISDSEGDDSNDGKSPETPWKTFRNLYDVKGGGALIIHKVKAGDAVLLKRGDTFNSLEYDIEYNYIDTVRGVTYGTYGEGEKPVISRELPMNEPAGKWTQTEYKNVWKLNYTANSIPGSVVFEKPDGTELWGIMVYIKYPSNPFGKKSVNFGTVFNGEEVFTSGGVKFENVGCLKNNLEYFCNVDTGEFFVYYDKGNPGEVFKAVHLSLAHDGIGYESKTTPTTLPTVIDNIAFKYIGNCAISAGETENLFVTNCTFEWIGGCYQGEDVRYGNAVQNWGNCDGIFIKDCYFRDVYDAAVSTQGSAGIMRNFYTDGCVLDRCDLSFEFFNHGDKTIFDTNELCNLFLTNNYVINNGYGFCDVREDRRSAFLYTTYGTNETIYENIVYSGNVNIFSAEYAVFSAHIALGESEGTILKDNVYYMDPDESYFGKFIYNMIDLTGYSSTLYPYTSQYLTYLNSIGVETGSTFYSVKNPAIDFTR